MYLSDKVFWPLVIRGLSLDTTVWILRFFLAGDGDTDSRSGTGLLVPLCALWLLIQWSTIRLAATMEGNHVLNYDRVQTAHNFCTSDNWENSGLEKTWITVCLSDKQFKGSFHWPKVLGNIGRNLNAKASFASFWLECSGVDHHWRWSTGRTSQTKLTIPFTFHKLITGSPGLFIFGLFMYVSQVIINEHIFTFTQKSTEGDPYLEYGIGNQWNCRNLISGCHTIIDKRFNANTKLKRRCTFNYKNKK